ncbi:MAG: hypothetical protein ACRDQA_26860 [Nocardioidaceae bacterium]
MMTWTLTLPYTRPVLSLNDRSHWAKKAKQTREIREASHFLARANHLPHCERVTVQLHYRQRVRRRIDGENTAPFVKACVDGLRDAGVVDDDDTSRVTHLPLVIHPPIKGSSAGETWLVIEETT